MDISGNARIVRRRLRHAATARGYARTDAEVAAELAVWLGKLDHEVFGPNVRIPVVFSERGQFSPRMLACYRRTTVSEAFMVFPAGLARRSRRMRCAITVPVSQESDAGRLPRRWEILAAVAAHEVRHRFQARASSVRLFSPAGAPKEPRDLVGFAWHELSARYSEWARHMTTLKLSQSELAAQLHETEFDALVVEHVVLVLAALGQDVPTLVQAITMHAPEAC